MASVLATGISWTGESSHSWSPPAARTTKAGADQQLEHR